MKLAEPYAYQEGFPSRGKWEAIHPSFLTIGGSGVVGDFGAESPMSRKHKPTYPKDVRAAGPTSGSGAAAGVSTNFGGSGLA